MKLPVAFIGHFPLFGQPKINFLLIGFYFIFFYEFFLQQFIRDLSYSSV